ncbi:camp-dependent protein kinase type 2 [Rhypophila decipiens]|uniref:cAMP-dependent protein kinase n=1 Tax=Rhypophila decipiens TaxID=261697 RepID=A0AAN6YHX4_9PEZI|nr:camp-dependent protein kinase type 2 [Rhypophila decipiens]
MPGLGFLKKKRTREGNTDQSAPSNPTSPVTPTTSRSWDQNPQNPGANASGAHRQSQPTATAPASQDAPSDSMNKVSAQQSYPPPQPTPSPGTDPQNLPSISNIVNTQHDPPATSQLQVDSQHGSFAPNGGTSSQAAQSTMQNQRQLPSSFPSQAYSYGGQSGQHPQPQQPNPGPQPYPSPQPYPGQQPYAAQPPYPAQQPYAPQPAYPAQQPYGNPQDYTGQQVQNPQAQGQHTQLQQSSGQQVQNQQSGGQSTPQTQGSQQSVARITKGKYHLQDFEILRTLGTGSFGRVHLVQSKHNSRFYAVKVLKKMQVVRMKQIEHTNDERRMLGEVKHPFLITLWGTFQDAKNLYMVMDFVEGGELFSLLRKSGRFPNPVAKFYAAEVTLALEYLHSHDIIYRDLKPENLLLDRHGHLKITDFGFAKRVPDLTWTLCGTPDYLAPEVVSNKGYNKSVDWWSLGILIYEMLCGYTPFWDGGSPMKIYENILKGRVKYPAYINAQAQNLLERLITADITKRLGNLYGGSQDVKNHPWFAEVTWDRLATKNIDAPYTPPVKAGAGDASQFDRYPEETEQYGATGPDEYGHLFPDF